MATFNSQHNVDVLVRGRDQFSGTMGRMNEGLKGMAGNVTAISTGFIAVNLALRQFMDYAKQTVERVAKFEDLSRQLNTTTTAVQQLEFISSQLDLNFQALARGLVMIQRNATGMGQEAATAADALEKIGVSVGMLEGRDPVELLEDMVTRIRNLKTESERAAVASDIFGRAYLDILKLVHASPEALEKTLLMMERMGITMDPGLVKAADDTADAWDRMARRMAAANDKTLLPILDTLTKFIEKSIEGKEAWNRMMDREAMSQAGLVDWEKTTKLRGPRPFSNDVADMRRAPVMDLAAGPMLSEEDIFWRTYGDQLKEAALVRPPERKGYDQPELAFDPIIEQMEEVRQSYEDMIDADIQFRNEVEETTRSGEQMGATLVATAFDFADATAQALAQAIVYHENFAQMMKQIWKQMITFLMGELLRLIYRQIIAATLQEVLFPGSTARATRTISSVTGGLSSGGGGASPVGMDSPQGSGAYRLPRLPQTGTVNITARTTLGSRNEARQLAATIAGYIAEVQAT